MPTARTRPKLSLEDVWDLEDQFTALAGSASGVQANASPVPADYARGGKTRVQEAARGAANECGTSQGCS